MAKYKILYWHDIPSQVRVEDGTDRVNRQLPERFQMAIEKAAMKAETTDGDSYMEGFQWSEKKHRAGTAEIVAAQVVEELEYNYPEIDWEKTAENIKEKRKK